MQMSPQAGNLILQIIQLFFARAQALPIGARLVPESNADGSRSGCRRLRRVWWGGPLEIQAGKLTAQPAEVPDLDKVRFGGDGQTRARGVKAYPGNNVRGQPFEQS